MAGRPSRWSRRRVNSACYFATSQNEGTIDAGLAIGNWTFCNYSPPHEFVEIEVDGWRSTGNICYGYGWLFDFAAVEPSDKPRVVMVDAYLHVPRATVTLSTVSGSYAWVKGEISVAAHCAGNQPLTSSHVFCVAGTMQGCQPIITYQDETMLTSAAVLMPQRTLVAVAVEVRMTAFLEADSGEINTKSGMAAMDLTRARGPSTETGSLILYCTQPCGPIRVEKIEFEIGEPVSW